MYGGNGSGELEEGRILRYVALVARASLLAPLLTVFSLGHAETASTKPIEEVVVTGSYIRGSAENAALPVDVVTNQDLKDVGSPSMIEFIRNLDISAGNLGETNQFNSPGQGEYGVTTINLRGLGSARTLTLINGRRQVATEDIGVDVSAFPMNAFARTEILKDGAAALYGSDAIAGVVNFITRKGFTGLELTGSNTWMDGSDGNQDLGLTAGWANDRLSGFLALEYNHRSQLKIRDKNWALKPFAQNYNGGWSTTGMPGTTYYYDPSLPLAPGNLPGTNQQAYVGPDPQCTNLGGETLFGTCDFQFSYYDNLIEATSQYKSYGEVNYDFNDTTTLHIEGLYSIMDMPDWKSSPAYPPNSLFGPDRIIPANHPGLIQYKADYPQLFTNLPAGQTIDTVEVYQRSRMLGVNGRNGNPLEAHMKTNTYRLGMDLKGEFSGIGWDFGVTYSRRHRVVPGYDMPVQGMAFALNGYGGPDCTPGGSDPATSTQGVGPCMWYNPFSEAIQHSATLGIDNPTYVPAVGNSQELIDWLTLKGKSATTNQLLVWDFVLNGDTGIQLPGGTIGWAAGLQARNEKYELKPYGITDLAQNPCPWTNPFAVTLGFTTPDQLSPNCTVKFGLVAFGVPFSSFNTNRRIYAAFTELALPVTDTLDMQAAVRFEDYGSSGGGSTVDPKLAIRWQALSWLALRGSISTTFRGPPQSYLGGRTTVLENIQQASAYRAVNYNGNPGLGPEKALATNLGLIFETTGLLATLDFWKFDFSDPFQLESAGQILGAYTANGCTGDGTPTNPYGPGVGSAVCNDLRPRFVPTGTTPANLASIDTYYTNGSDITTDGLDLAVSYNFPAFGGDMTVGTNASYILQYKSQAFRTEGGTLLAPGGDFAGLVNVGVNPFYPLPELKGNAFVRFNWNGLRLSYTYRYISDYDDRLAANPPLKHIDSMGTHDVTAIYDWRDFSFSASVINLTDEDPPKVYMAQNYDPYTHNPFGRMVKFQVTYNLGGG